MSNIPNENTGRTIRSVEITLNIIDILQSEGDVGVTMLAEELGHSKSTIHSHLHTLERNELIVADDDGYRLSLQILDMANQVRDQVGNYDVIKQEVDKLAKETEEIAQFGLEEHGKLIYLYKAVGEQSVETASKEGTQQPLYSTALGKTILACSPPKHVDEFLENTTLRPKTPNTITEEEEFRKEMDRIRERGYGLDDEENISGLRCVAAPVSDNQHVLGAVSITGPSSRFSIDYIHENLADHALSAANVIELNTKFA